MANGNFGGGDGTKLNPYLVEDAQDLWAVRNNLSAHYKQTADIDLNVYSTGEGWIPIGQATVEFTGVYDGDNYEIRNLWSASLAGHGGLFGRANGAKFKNINLRNVIIVSATENYMGGLVGYAENMTEDSIYNCHVSGVVNESNSSKTHIGGVVGYCSGSGVSINKCSFEGIIKSSQYGLGYIGGICGHCNTSIKNSYSLGNIVAPSVNYLGGLCGLLYNNNVCSYSYSLVNINEGLNADARYVGGLIGGIGSNSRVLKSWARGSVSGSSQVGGFIGLNQGSIVDCYSTGFVVGNTGVGGFCGSNNGSIINSVWDTETSGQTTSSGGIGKTTAEMKNKQTYIDLGWSIT
ncbi:GLUG motif-containing protein [Acetivibrio straminisolvens]|uniref:GLUG motif-containing protein n=1 Tax=Acetivibrio straminisolvens TaxID=253314 RepID=UPI00223FDEED|nr:GLUG motif-containing protein [Acetivibrio straminisolvens]